MSHTLSRLDFLKTGSLALGAGLTALSGLKPAISAASRPGKAKNIIFLVSDGMSSGTLALADLMKREQFGQTTNWIQLYESKRNFHRGLMDMATLDSTVPDSAAAASSWGCGQRINNGALNWGPNDEQHKPIAAIFRDAGKGTGLVTSTRITHATPSGFAINMPSRNQEDDIAVQYSERNYDVLLGGGDRHFNPAKRSDNRDLYATFRSKGYNVVTTKTALSEVPQTGKLLGIFNDSHLPYMVDFNSDAQLQAVTPTLAEMTKSALNRLNSHDNGFILQVEGGRVDHAAHANDAASLVYDQIAFDEAVGEVLDFVDGRDDTLVILTTDHGNANPGLGGRGSGYRESPKLFETLQDYRKSLEWVYEEMGYNWQGPALENVSAAKVRELVEYAANTQITSDEADMIKESFEWNLRVPFQDRMAPGAVISGVLANYNGVYFIGTNHTADYVEIAAIGPGSDRIPYFVRNTDIFELMVEMADVRAYSTE